MLIYQIFKTYKNNTTCKAFSLEWNERGFGEMKRDAEDRDKWKSGVT